MAIHGTKRAESRTRYYLRSEATSLGWDVQHPDRGGQFLEEHEIVDYFPLLAQSLGHQRPDFVTTLSGNISVVIECKSNWHDLDSAAIEATEYADLINQTPGHDARIAVGVAGTPDRRVHVRCMFWDSRQWTNLTSHGYALTQLPTIAETQIAFENGDGTTDVQLPDEREFFSAATRISRIMRLAKIEEALRPKVLGAIILALYHADFAMDPDVAIENINTNVRAAINKFTDLSGEGRDFLRHTLLLSTEADGLRPRIEDVVHQLERLNIRSIMRSGVDFLGQFYETFLRYGQDSKKLGIVFTPRHITRMCADLVGVDLGHTVYDPACGTGGFLVAAFDNMMAKATTTPSRLRARQSLYGFDTNPTVWALAVLNMFFRGDGKSSIEYGNCFDSPHNYAKAFDRALLNPPFSQEGEPETDFVDHALSAVKPGGRVAVVVKTSVLVDAKLRKWRQALVTDHHVEAIVTLPVDLFYPTASPTVILVARAHNPDKTQGTLVARVENDGYEISKNRRVSRTGSQVQAIIDRFREFERSHTVATEPNFVTIVPRQSIIEGDEICAERWLPSAPYGLEQYEYHRIEALRSLSLAIANYPDITDELIPDLEDTLVTNATSTRPQAKATLSSWFSIRNGRSTGSKNYPPGSTPYISSGDSNNGIVSFIEPDLDEVYSQRCITVSAFGQAHIQPWRFTARGNGGSAVRVLQPKHSLSITDLLWFVGQINSQKWRFHYGRMAIPNRLGSLLVAHPPDLPEMPPLREKLLSFRSGLDVLIGSENYDIVSEFENAIDTNIAMTRLREIERNEQFLVTGKELDTILSDFSR